MKKSLLLSLTLMMACISIQAQVIITEIMYNNAGTDDLEYIELYNNSDTAIDLEGYSFTAGLTHTFSGVNIDANGFVLLAKDSIFFLNVFGQTAYQWQSGALTNGGENIELSDAAGNIVDSVDYDDAAPWSTFVDGNGPSLVLCDPNSDNNDGANWQASSTPTGLTLSNVPLLASPGSLACATTPLLSLDEFEASASEADGVLNFEVRLENAAATETTVQVEILATSTADVDTDFTLSATTLTFPANSTDPQPLEVTLVDDFDMEEQEFINLILTNPSNDAILLTEALTITVSDNDTPLTQQMVLTGIFDAQLPGMAGTKGFEIYVLDDIADISSYGIGVANNGGGTDGLEWDFPADAASAGDYIYVAVDSTEFHDYFGFAPTYVAGVAAVNGDDAVELYENAQVIDTYGDVETDGSGEAWEYTDSWANRRLGTGPDGSTFVLENWIISYEDALDGAETNADAPTPFPIGTYIVPTVVVAQNDAIDGDINTPTTINILNNDFVPGTIQSVTPILSSATIGSVSVDGDNNIIYTPAMDFCGSDSFSYELCDESSCDQATVTISIACPPAYPAYTIGTVTTNDATGVPDSMDVTCQLAGRVYGVNIKNDGGLSFVIMDAANDGIVCFADEENFGYTVNEGDEVTVSGRIDQYNGLTELILDNVEVTTLNIPEVSPTVVTELNESTESQLVKIEHVWPVDPSEWDAANGTSGFNVRFTNILDTFIVRIDNDVDLYNSDPPILSQLAEYDIIGIGGQFDFTSPFTDGYQILPRYMSDVELTIVSTKEISFDFEVSIFPNPSVKDVFIQSEQQLDELILTNSLGQTLQIIQQPNLTQQLDVQQFPSGNYTITMVKDGIRVSKQLFIR